MAKDRNTYAKRQRESGKKQKAADKRARRLKRKENGNENENEKVADSPDDHTTSEQ